MSTVKKNVDNGLLEDVVREHVLSVLLDSKNNRTLAAKRLGIGLRTLQRYLIKWTEMGTIQAQRYEATIGRRKASESLKVKKYF